jgi:threonylcarbamoyladenosine tRNA methylthiotransferase MtaB
MKLFVRTFGCRANHYDSEAVMQAATRGGYELVDDPATADVAVFNSCAVTSEAERDVRKAVRRAATANPRLRTVVMGCAAALPGSAATLRGLPTVEYVIGGGDVAAVAAALEVPGGSGATVRQRSVRAVLRVQDGCDEHCTFCATTLARGANRSRPIAALIDEATALAEHHPEIVITGTHIGTYGADIGSSLGALLAQLVQRVPLVRFRLSSIEATEVDPPLAELLTGAAGRVMPHLHAPLQSGSDRVLRRMGRHWYTAGSYRAAIERVVAPSPVFGLGADIIVGFPGETEEDFAATENLVRQLPFTYLHVFTYSPRTGTAAPRLPDAVAPDIARARSLQLRDLAADKARDYAGRRAGSAADVVVHAGAPNREGTTEDYLTVPITGARSRGQRYATTVRLDRERQLVTSD